MLGLGGEHAALDGDDARNLVAILMPGLDQDLAVEGERNERHRARRDGLDQALADEAAGAENGDRPALEIRRVVAPEASCM